MKCTCKIMAGHPQTKLCKNSKKPVVEDPDKDDSEFESAR